MEVFLSKIGRLRLLFVLTFVYCIAVLSSDAFADLISKKLHFIWIGDKLPERYIRNVLDFASLNKDYKISIWTDHALKLNEAFNQYEFYSKNLMNVRDVSEIKKQIPVKALNYLDRESSGVFSNYAAASDILRLFILYSEGGVYLDIDNSPKKHWVI